MASEFKKNLIELVRSQPILWDTTFENFRNSTLKWETWSKIAKSLSATPDECKKTFQGLRDTYVKIKNGHRKSNGRLGEESVKWKYYQEMSFLSDHFKHRNSPNEDSGGAADVEGSSNDRPYYLVDDLPLAFCQNRAQPVAPPSSSVNGDHDDAEESSAESTKSIRKRAKLDEFNEELYETIQKLSQSNGSSGSSSADDEFDLFGKFVAIQLRQLPPPMQREVIYGMNTLLYIAASGVSFTVKTADT